MEFSSIVIYFLAYLIPSFFFVAMITTILNRNRQSKLHLLLTLILFFYMQLFLAEFVRNMLPVQYSSYISSIWFSNAGVFVTLLTIHFFIQLCQLDQLVSRKVYYLLFAVSFSPVIFNIASNAMLFSTTTFVVGEPFHYPVYNSNYYVTLTAAIVMMLLYVGILTYGLRRAPTKQYEKIYKILLYSVYFAIAWHIIFGYFKWPMLPPYPYIYGGIIWCYYLLVAMYRYDFIERYDSRYEKLFERNPDAIFLVSKTSLDIVNLNPAAKKLLKKVGLEEKDFIGTVPKNILEQITEQAPSNHSTVPYNDTFYFDVVTDYVYIDGVVHYLIIVHDATEKVLQLHQIRQLAYYDTLTQIPNRRLFEEQFQASQSAKADLAIALIDLDYLKRLNDQHGHLIGDEAICNAATILVNSTHTFGFASRLGGDEFIACLDLQIMPMSIDEWIKLVRTNYQQSMAHISDIPLSLSVGISYLNRDATELNELMQIADKRMYEMKQQNKQGHSI